MQASGRAEINRITTINERRIAINNENDHFKRRDAKSKCEELQTVNAELQNKLSDFEQANNDMNNLLNST
jgi:two-component system CheB/CheR fusion protein